MNTVTYKWVIHNINGEDLTITSDTQLSLHMTADLRFRFPVSQGFTITMYRCEETPIML